MINRLKVEVPCRTAACIAAVVLPLFLPIILLLIWHLQNHRWPNDDAANYVTTAYHIFERFQNQGVYQGLLALHDVRGWRPTALPTLLVPYLLIFRGNIPLAVGGALWTLYCLMTLYAYKLCRLFLLPGRAVISAAVVATSPVLMLFATVFFAELAWVCFAIAWTYHLLCSKEFRSIFHSSLAGTFWGLMVLTRPAESIAIAAIPVSYFLIQAVRHRAIRWSDLVLASSVVTVSGGLLGASLYFAPITTLQIWLATGVTVTLCLMIAFRRRNLFSLAHLLFWTCFCSVIAFWWAGFVRQLYEWAYATSFGQAAKLLTPERYTHFLTALVELVGFYGAVQIWWLIGVALVALGIPIVFRERTSITSPRTDDSMTSTRMNSNLTSGRDNENAYPIKHLALMAVGTLLPILGLYWLSSTGEPRRAMVGMTLVLLALSIAALSPAGPVTKLRVVFVSMVPLLQIWHVLPAFVDLPTSGRASAICCGPSLPAPFSGQDGNVLMADMLARKLPKNSLVAVYTLALSSPPNRVYEPAALQLALATRKTPLAVGYVWDEGSYDVVIGRLAQLGHRYLLVDSWDDQTVRQSNEPHVLFTARLLDAFRHNGNNPPGLRLVDSFTVSGRRQLLFEITVTGLVPNDTAENALSWLEENIASARHGARAVTTNHQNAFDDYFLNDDSPQAWGSAEGQDDVFAGIVLSKPQMVRTVRIVVFSPGGRAHLRDLSIVATDAENFQAANWRVVRSRIQGQRFFSEKITVPALPDNTAITVEVDSSDPNAGRHRLWGVACLSSSRGYARNYVPVGAGVYIRELQMKAVSTHRGAKP
jgi:hypothetical protein